MVRPMATISGVPLPRSKSRDSGNRRHLQQFFLADDRVLRGAVIDADVRRSPAMPREHLLDYDLSFASATAWGGFIGSSATDVFTSK